MKRPYWVIAIAALAVILSHGVGHAQATRTWVSALGDDANPCSLTAACKTFAGAISKTAAGGEINTLDEGAFGAVTITKSISIVNQGGTAGVLAAGTNGIIVNLSSATGRVYLEGLDIEGAGTGLNGIRMIGLGFLTVRNTLIRNFTQNGIDIQGGSGVLVTVEDTTISDSTTGIRVQAAAGAPISAFVYDSMIDRASGASVSVTGFAAVQLKNSVLTSRAGSDILTADGGKVISFGDNVIRTGTPTQSAAFK